jgi:hypothetical protein
VTVSSGIREWKGGRRACSRKSSRPSRRPWAVLSLARNPNLLDVESLKENTDSFHIASVAESNGSTFVVEQIRSARLAGLTDSKASGPDEGRKQQRHHKKSSFPIPTCNCRNENDHGEFADRVSPLWRVAASGVGKEEAGFGGRAELLTSPSPNGGLEAFAGSGSMSRPRHIQ